MLRFICEGCDNVYEAEIVEGGVIYYVDNKRIELNAHDDDCFKCTQEAKIIINQLRAEKKARKTI